MSNPKFAKASKLEQKPGRVPYVPRPGPPHQNLYSAEEDQEILNYVIKSRNFSALKGYQFWRVASTQLTRSRSYSSLHERFRKYIFPNINK